MFAPTDGPRGDARPGRRARGRDEAPPDAGRLHHRAALLQAAEQHRHARRPPVVGERRSSSPRRRSRTRRPPAGSRQTLAAAGAGHAPTRPTSCPTTRRSAASRFSPGYFTSAATGAAARACARPPAATASTSYGASAASRPRPGTRRTTGSTRSSARRRPRDTRAPASRGSHAGRRRQRRRRRPPSRRVSFDEPMNAPHVSAPSLTLSDDPAPRRSPASSSYDAPTATATLTPAPPLALGRTLHGHGRGGAERRHGRGGQPARRGPSPGASARRARARARSSRPATARSATPTNDSPLEVGMKFRVRPRTAGSRALRFYKQPNNTGTHVGHLWTASGTQLGRGRRSRTRRPPGWQQAELPSPIADRRRTRRYVTSYHAAARVASRFSPGFFGPASTAPPLQRAGRLGRPAATASTSYGASGFPDADLRRDELLGRRHLRAHAARPTPAAAGRSSTAPPPAPSGVAARQQGQGHVRRAARPPDRQHRLDPADGRRGQRRRRHRHLRRGDHAPPR